MKKVIYLLLCELTQTVQSLVELHDHIFHVLRQIGESLFLYPLWYSPEGFCYASNDQRYLRWCRHLLQGQQPDGWHPQNSCSCLIKLVDALGDVKFEVQWYLP